MALVWVRQGNELGSLKAAPRSKLGIRYVLIAVCGRGVWPAAILTTCSIALSMCACVCVYVHVACVCMCMCGRACVCGGVHVCGRAGELVCSCACVCARVFARVLVRVACTWWDVGDVRMCGLSPMFCLAVHTSESFGEPRALGHAAKGGGEQGDQSIPCR